LIKAMRTIFEYKGIKFGNSIFNFWDDEVSWWISLILSLVGLYFLKESVSTTK